MYHTYWFFQSSNSNYTLIPTSNTFFITIRKKITFI